MTITIRLKTNNAAFDDPGEWRSIVQDAARRVANDERDFKLRDVSGNTVGSVRVTGK